MKLERVTKAQILEEGLQLSSDRVLRDYIPAISLHQPWASWMAEGKKTIETRGYPTKFRGDILICSTLKHGDTFAAASKCPIGVALCIVDIHDCRPMTAADEEHAMCSVYSNAHSWMTRNLRRLAAPLRVTGKQGIFFVRTRGIVLEAA